MKKIKKIIVATAAAFAVIAAIGATTAFANSDAVPPVDEVNNYQVRGTYMYFAWGEGFTKTTNITTNYRRCVAEVTAYKNLTGEEVDFDSKYKDCYHNEYAYAYVEPEYIGSNYNYTCYGYIRGDASTNSPKMEYETRYYPLS